MTDDSIDPGNDGAPKDDMRPQCGAMTKNGARCKNRPLANGYFWMHGGGGHKPDTGTNGPVTADMQSESRVPDATVSPTPPDSDTDTPPEAEDTESDFEPAFFIDTENAEPESPAEQIPPDHMTEGFDDETPILIDPDLEFEPDPETTAQASTPPAESPSSDMPSIPESEEDFHSQDSEEGVIELDLSGLELEIETPSADGPTRAETALEAEADDPIEATEPADSGTLRDGDIQMPEAFRIELESEGEAALPEPEDRAEASEEHPDLLNADETLELEMDLSDDVSAPSQEPSEEPTQVDAPEQEIEGRDPDSDMEAAPGALEIESPRETDESDESPPDLELESTELDVGYTPEGKPLDEEGEQVVAPPHFDLFEELPGEDWIEIEVNIEEGEYSTGNLDEFSPDLILDKDSPGSPQSGPSDVSAGDTDLTPPKALVSDTLFEEEDTDQEDFPTEADARAERAAKPHVGQVEPTYYVSAAEAEKNLLKRRVSLPLLLIAGLLILTAGLTFGLTTLFQAPGPADAGDAAIRLVDIDSRFVANQKAGTLLVITGRAINDYDHPRSFIRVTGKVYTSDRFVQSISVFCGNFLTEKELQTLPISDMVELLLRRTGRYKRNMNISSGSATPLMIVFPIPSDTLERLDSYTVEVVESKPS